MGFADVARPDASCQTVDGIVRPRRKFLGIVKRNRRYNGTEDFLLHHLHAVFGVHKNGGLNEVALAAELAAASSSPRAFANSDLEIVANALELLFGNQRAHLRIGFEAGTNFDVAGMFGDAFHDLIKSGAFHIQTRSRAAALAVIEEDSAGRAGNRRFQIGVFEYDVR